MIFKKSVAPDATICQNLLAGLPLRRAAENALFEKYYYLTKEATFKHNITHEDAFSAYSDAILAVIEAVILQKFKETASLKTFVYQIFNNKCVDQIRKNSTNKMSVNKGVALDDASYQLPDTSKNMLQQLCDNWQIDRLKAELEKIGEKCKTMLTAWAEGYSDLEICQMLAYNNAHVVKTSRLRCLQKLKDNYLN